MKVYLAGPFFNEKQIKIIDKIEKAFDEHEINYFSPRKGGGIISDLPVEERMKRSKEIYQSNIDNMIDSDILFAVVDGRDTGTVYEMGYFKSLDDHGVSKGGYLKDLFQSRRFSVTYTDENFGLNIMLKESVAAHIVGEEDLEKFCGSLRFYGDQREDIPMLERSFKVFQNFNPEVE